MINHSKSFLLSLLIHALVILSLFSVYKYVFSSNKPAQQEKKICVNLMCIKPKVIVEKKLQKKAKTKELKHLLKKIIKKPVIRKKTPIKKPKKIKKPKEIKKKVFLKKKIKKEEPKIIEKPVEPAEPVKAEEPIKPIEEKLQIEQKTKITENESIENKVVQNRMSEEEQYLENNLAKIAKLIKENLYYPRMARKRGIQGLVTVRFMLLKDASVTQITTISSNNGILTRAAIRTIAELSGKFPKPKADLMLTVPIQYSLH